MSNNYQDTKSFNIGKIITFGSLHLLFKLRLEDEDISLGKFKALKELDKLTFLTENEKLWNKIELKTNNDLLNVLLQINKIKIKKSIISYLVYDKIEYNEKQKKFQKLIDYVLLDNGLVIYSYAICNCKISINLKLSYKKYTHQYCLYGEEDFKDDDEEKSWKDDDDNNGEEWENKNKHNIKTKRENYETINNNNNKNKNDDNENEEDFEENEDKEEEDTNDLGLFEKMPLEEIKFEDFKYIYIHFKDYINDGEFSSEFKLHQIYNFLKKLKKTGIKIIFNFGEDFGKNRKYIIKFLRLSDIHLFREKNALFNMLKKKYENEEKKRVIEKEKMKILFKTQKSIKTYKIKKLRKNTSMTNLRKNRVNQNTTIRDYNNDNTSLKNTVIFNESQSLKDLLNSISLTGERLNKSTLGKNKIYKYLKDVMYMLYFKEKHPNYNDKTGIYLDEYKKIYIVDYKKDIYMPSLVQYDLNIYPKSNIYSANEIKKLRNEYLIKHNNKYTYILYGSILSALIDNINCNSYNYFMLYYYSRISLLKLLAIEKNNLPIPKDKSFYFVHIDKNELNKMMKEETTKKKEEGFNNNHFQIKYRGNSSRYYPLMDKFLTSYMQSGVNIEILRNKNLINEKKKILYDPEYKELYKYNFNPIDINENKLAKFIMNANLSKNLNVKEKDYKKEFLNKKPEMKYHLPGTNGVPEYIVYLNKSERKKMLKKKLPPLKKKKDEENKDEEKDKKSEDKENEDILPINLRVGNEEEKKELLKRGSVREIKDVNNENENANDDNEKNEEEKKEEKINTDKYKEIKFMPTPSEANNP